MGSCYPFQYQTSSWHDSPSALTHHKYWLIIRTASQSILTHNLLIHSLTLSKFVNSRDPSVKVPKAYEEKGAYKGQKGALKKFKMKL